MFVTAMPGSLRLKVRFKSSGCRADDRRGGVAQRRRAVGTPLLRSRRPDLLRRNAGNQRRYDRTILRRVALIQAGGRPGSRSSGSAPRSRPCRRSGRRRKRDWERLSRGWRDDLDARIATLAAVRDRLTTCIGCGCLSLGACRLLNPGDEAAEQGAGAQYLERD